MGEFQDSDIMKVTIFFIFYFTHSLPYESFSIDNDWNSEYIYLPKLQDIFELYSVLFNKYNMTCINTFTVSNMRDGKTICLSKNKMHQLPLNE